MSDIQLEIGRHHITPNRSPPNARSSLLVIITTAISYLPLPTHHTHHFLPLRASESHSQPRFPRNRDIRYNQAGLLCW